MTYSDATEMLFNSLPMFQNVGAGAYKPGLERTLALAEAFGVDPSRGRFIHVAGTNGKGSTASLLAAALSASGLRTGLYTSPHLVDFRERMRVDGSMISPAEVVDFVERWQWMKLPVEPSFFELTTVMALEWFARRRVDVAVLEAGLGGRLDSTNIVTPLLSVITNISLDHTALLGHTLPAIAAEKAGIIKPGVPVVIGEAGSPEVRWVFASRAADCGAPVVYASDWQCARKVGEGHYLTEPFGELTCPLAGEYQQHNVNTAVAALATLSARGIIPLKAEDVRRGFSEVERLSGLAGRWMKLGSRPDVICDTGHNPGGWEHIARQLSHTRARQIHMVIGFAADKDVAAVLAMMPRDAVYHFTQAPVRRAMDARELQALAAAHGLQGTASPTVAEAYGEARARASADDLIFVGGSTFVVAALLSALQ